MTSGNKTSAASFSIFGLFPPIPVDLLGSSDFKIDFNSSDFISGILKLTHVGNLLSLYSFKYVKFSYIE